MAEQRSVDVSQLIDERGVGRFQPATQIGGFARRFLLRIQHFRFLRRWFRRLCLDDAKTQSICVSLTVPERARQMSFS